MTKKKNSSHKGMRFSVPTELHKKIVAHQKLMNLKTDDFISVDAAAIDLLQRAASAIPALN